MIQSLYQRFPDVSLIAGVDEVGRGPIFGPVVAAAVILPPDHGILGLRDSKKLSASKRLQLLLQIKAKALCWQVVSIPAARIDEINILQASLLAMRLAVEALTPQPLLAVFDGNKVPAGMRCRTEAVVGGDDALDGIAAASIVAKVARDAALAEMALRYPGYGLAAHKGYPTVKHLQALQQLGVTPEHRRSFAPVKKRLEFPHV